MSSCVTISPTRGSTESITSARGFGSMACTILAHGSMASMLSASTLARSVRYVSSPTASCSGMSTSAFTRISAVRCRSWALPCTRKLGGPRSLRSAPSRVVKVDADRSSIVSAAVSSCSPIRVAPPFLARSANALRVDIVAISCKSTGSRSSRGRTRACLCSSSSSQNHVTFCPARQTCAASCAFISSSRRLGTRSTHRAHALAYGLSFL
mmetsp:Transcript_4805/g.21758  ORF Transcript_4805/g.21758 Transcript_4805/m.21758 type:complete len:210 (-) Transcript_4805:1647-2276(-)